MERKNKGIPVTGEVEDGTLYVSPQDDFGLALNAAVRMYRRDVSEDTLNLLGLYFSDLLEYIDSRTLWCALADLQPEAVDLFCPEIPEDQRHRFGALRDIIAEEYFMRSTEDDYVLHGRSMNGGLITSPDGHRGMFPDGGEFLAWLHKLREMGKPIGYRDVPAVPLPPECAGKFGQLVVLMCRYSVGRMTYMPLTAAQFAMVNRDALGRTELEAIWDAVGQDGDPSWNRLQGYLREKLGKAGKDEKSVDGRPM